MSISITSLVRPNSVRAVAIGVALSLAPLVPSSTPVHADTPAASVNGLARGARGDAVAAVQQALINQGVAVAGGVDGVFGPVTEAAIETFQSKQGLSVTGAVDEGTALALGLAASDLLGLTRGTEGGAVRKLQQRLVDRGVAVRGGVDGIFGAGTEAAVKDFQSGRGLPATGTVDVATVAALASSGSGGSAQGDTDAEGSDQGESAGAASTEGIVGLKIGARSDAVKRVQQLMLDAGFDVVGGADGIFGVLTASALSRFQERAGLPATAVVDRATADALVAAATKRSGGDKSGDGDGRTAGSPLLGLEYGAGGRAVRQLQQALLDSGINVRGGADGIFGSATKAALQQFQSARGIDATGKVDEATAKSLAGGGRPDGVAKPNVMAGLKAGALGTAVQQLQRALLDAGVDVRGGADGIFGPATAKALKEFQSSQGLTATGVVDDATLRSLANPKAAVAGKDASGGEGGFAAYGETGARVMSLQSALVKAGVEPRGGVDGLFGSGTSAAVMEYQRQQGLAVTGKVDTATAAALGLTKESAPTAPDPSNVEIAVFPVQGSCGFADTWHYPRGGGRLHLGVDVIAPEGRLLYAAVDGTITKVYADYPGSLTGNGVKITTADGTYFFYAHMQGLAEGIAEGTKVKAGQIVGTVGNTGNSGTPHLHLEIHPKGGAAINPYPLVKAIDGCGTSTVPPQP